MGGSASTTPRSRIARNALRLTTSDLTPVGHPAQAVLRGRLGSGERRLGHAPTLPARGQALECLPAFVGELLALRIRGPYPQGIALEGLERQLTLALTRGGRPEHTDLPPVGGGSRGVLEGIEERFGALDDGRDREDRIGLGGQDDLALLGQPLDPRPPIVLR